MTETVDVDVLYDLVENWKDRARIVNESEDDGDNYYVRGIEVCATALEMIADGHTLRCPNLPNHAFVMVTTPCPECDTYGWHPTEQCEQCGYALCPCLTEEGLRRQPGNH